MTIKFFRTSEPYGCFSNFSKHTFFLDGKMWKTTEHYFQAQKFKHDSEDYNDVNKAETPKTAALIGRDRNRPLLPEWEQIKDDVMRKCVLKKFQVYSDIRKILLETGDQDIIEDSPYDAYWGAGPNGNGKNMLGKILVETREYLKEFTHCLTCGTTHRIKESCPMDAFRILTCSCGNETLIPCDALFMGVRGMHCGQCEKDTDWAPKIPTLDDIKKHWENYGQNDKKD
jgi:hypothetical protein